MPATYEPIATSTLGSAAATITFSSISSAYTDIHLVLVARDASGSDIRLRFNSDTASNYSRTNLISNGDGGVTTNRNNNQTSIVLGTGITTTGVWGLYEVDIFSYTNTNTRKTVLITASEDKGLESPNRANNTLSRRIGLWRSTSTITTIQISATSGTFPIGTTATIYGILRA